MSDRAIKITARAFNNECEACVSNVRWNNVERMEERIRKSFDAINKLNASNRVMISESYLRLKLKELRLVYEHQQKLQDEKEEQAEMRRRLKEEERFEQEAQNAQKEELKYAKLLEKARAESQKAMGADLIKLNSEIARLTADLAQAQAKSQRALSMAQQTKVGHVYIISNIGSFGENVYKIGMTRRLEPMERVKELGDASVPFLFDVHAMIYCEDAPKLEKALHKAFEPKRLNMTNNRREFFHVTLDEIKIEVAKLYPNIDFVEVPEAMEFRQSLAIRHEKLVSQDAKSQIPSAI